MTFFNKLKWILGIVMIFILVLTTNLIDKNNFTRIKNSVVTIYEDRLIANDLIFEMLEIFHKKEISIIKADTVFYKNTNPKLNIKIENLTKRFSETKLTTRENNIFKDLKQNSQLLLDIESKNFLNSDEKNLTLNLISKVKSNLNDLAKVQLTEGRRQMSISKHTINTVELFTQIEIYFLVFLAIVVQVIVIYRPKK